MQKIKEISLRFSQGSVRAFQIMTNYQEARVKLKNTQLDKLRYAAKKKKTGTILRLNFKKLDMKNCHIPNNKRNN